MSLPLTMTLTQIREDVLRRCGYSTEGNQAAAVTPMLNSMIAGAERELFPEMTWLNSQARTTITIEEDEDTIDWPDDCEPGEIKSIWVVRSDTGELSELHPGVMINERNSSDLGESGRPLLYEYMDKQIYLKPPPSEDYTSLVVTYLRAPSLIQEGDRCVVDPELLIQRATFKFKEFNDMPIGPTELANHERYMARLRAMNSNKSGFVMGGHKSWRTDVQRRNRIAKDSRSGPGSPYTADWSPF